MPLKVKATARSEDKHEYDVTSVIFHKGFVYTGADDGKIIKWDENLKKVGEVKAHPCSVYSICSMDDTIYSCSNEGTIKSFTVDLKEKATLMTSQCEFWKVAASDGLLYVGDDAGIVRTFESDYLKGTYELLEPAKDMKVKNNTVFISRDCGVVITTIGQGQKITYANRKQISGRAPLDLVGDKIVTADVSAKGILIYENSTQLDYKQSFQIKDAHEMIINAVTGIQKGVNLFFYSAGWDKVVKEWMISEGNCKANSTCKVDYVVNCLTVNEAGVLYAGCSDGNVLRLDV